MDRKKDKVKNKELRSEYKAAKKLLKKQERAFFALKKAGIENVDDLKWIERKNIENATIQLKDNSENKHDNPSKASASKKDTDNLSKASASKKDTDSLSKDSDPEETGNLSKNIASKKEQIVSEEEKQRAALKKEIESIALRQKEKNDWAIPFDNAALIFPASETTDMLNMFRITALLKSDVDPILLQTALNFMVKRFPAFTSAVKKGLFWFYLETGGSPLIIKEQAEFPCRKIPVDSRHALIRVTYFKKEVSVEFFHVATDANGGVVFLNTLLSCYFQLQGHKISDSEKTLNYLDFPRTEEITDAFHEFADMKTKFKEKEPRAFCMSGKKLSSSALLHTKGIMDAGQLNAAAKKLGMTITELCVFCLITAIENEKKQQKKGKKHPVVITVPVNLRKYYPTSTMRNFVYVMGVSDEGTENEEQLIEAIKKQFKEKNTMQHIMGWVNSNVRLQKNPFMKIVPLPIKTLAMRIALKLRSDKVTSTCLSNIGRVDTPEEFKALVHRYEFSLGPQSYGTTALAAATFGSTAVFTFARTIKENNIEKDFFRKLAKLGVDIAIETNYDDEEV
jgi:hypothetical protein